MSGVSGQLAAGSGSVQYSYEALEEDAASKQGVSGDDVSLARANSITSPKVRPHPGAPGSKGVSESVDLAQADGLQRHKLLGEGGRVGSEPDMQKLLVDSTQAEAKDARRLFTLPILGASRRDRVCVPPESLARLHMVHEEMKASLGKGDPLEDTSEAALEGAWGSRASWHIRGDLPDKRERPFNARTFKALPTNERAENIMRRCQVAVLNTKGCKGHFDCSVGQDNYSISLLDSGWEVVCLMDGHGPHGEFPATRTAKTLPYLLQASSGCATMLRKGQIEAALLHAFQKAEEDLVRTSLAEDIELQVCGCTAVCVVKNSEYDKIWVAHTGDSRAIMIAAGKGVVAETVDHTPAVPAERQRVEEKGCDVEVHKHPDGYVEMRLHVKGEEYPGIGMTRSLGDLVVKDCGVIATPEVSKWSMEGLSEAYVVVASDGVWEFMSSELVSKLVLDAVADGKSLENICHEIVESSRGRWKEQEDDYCDDITVVLMKVSDDNTKSWRRSTWDKESCCGAGIRRACTVM